MKTSRLRERVVICSVALLGFGVAGCSSNDEPESNSNPIPPGETEAFELEFRLEDVPPGIEGTRCIQMRLPNDEPVAIGRLVNTISSSSHHFVVSSLAERPEGEPPLEENRTPTECRPFQAPLLGSPLAITQKHEDSYSLPPGIGYALVPHQMIHLELHYINSGTEPVDILAQSELIPLKAGELVHEASVMVVGNLDVQIPPNSEHVLGPTYREVPEQYNDVSIYAMTGHTHRYGTNVHVDSMDAPNGTTTPRYALDNFVWDAPEVVTFDPAFKVPAGGGFSYTCSWNNPTGDMITFGESANQEMCFFWVYYYPKKPGRALLLTMPPSQQ
jgi:hypothetical protein